MRNIFTHLIVSLALSCLLVGFMQPTVESAERSWIKVILRFLAIFPPKVILSIPCRLLCSVN